MKIKLQHLAKVICQQHGVSKDDFFGGCRKREFVRPRFVFYHIATQRLGYSYCHTARFLGGRDHTTVISGSKKAVKRGWVDDQDRVIEMARIEAENYNTNILTGVKKHEAVKNQQRLHAHNV